MLDAAATPHPRQGTPSPPRTAYSRIDGTAAVAPVAISCTSLPRCKAEPLTPGDAYSGATFRMGVLVEGHGGDPLRSMVLTESMFGADAMEAGGDVPFERMKVVQLKEELAARGSTRTGLKMVLQRRLHAMLMQSAIERQAREMED